MDKRAFVNLAIRYGGIVVILAVVFDVWVVMKYRELLSTSLKSREQAAHSEMEMRRMQIMLQEIVPLANKDQTVLQILQRGQQRASAPAAPAAAVK